MLSDWKRTGVTAVGRTRDALPRRRSARKGRSARISESKRQTLKKLTDNVDLHGMECAFVCLALWIIGISTFRRTNQAVSARAQASAQRPSS